MLKKTFRIFLLSFVGVSFLYLIFTSRVSSKDIVSPDYKLTNGFVVYYFHTTARCFTCKLLDRYANEAIINNFSSELKDGKLSFLSINVSLEANKSYIKDFSLLTKSVVIAYIKDAKVQKWKNLDQIWQLVKDEQKYKKYIVDELSLFIKEKI